MDIKIPKIVGLLATMVLLLSACGLVYVRGSGNLISEPRSVSDFDRVSLSGSGEVIITQSGEESLIVETDDNVMEYVTTSVRGGTLYLGFEAKKARAVSPSRLSFSLDVKDLVGLKISGSGSVDSASIDTDRLEVEVSGSGDVRIDSLTADEVDVRISGSGNVELAGEAAEQDVTISGSGDATVWAIDSLDARISGSGSVKYYGRPTTNLSGSGSGKFSSLDEK